jgi:hypothetical protein
MSGYWALMGVPQDLHLPLSQSQESTGMFW